MVDCPTAEVNFDLPPRSAFDVTYIPPSRFELYARVGLGTGTFCKFATSERNLLSFHLCVDLCNKVLTYVKRKNKTILKFRPSFKMGNQILLGKCETFANQNRSTRALLGFLFSCAFILGTARHDTFLIRCLNDKFIAGTWRHCVIATPVIIRPKVTVIQTLARSLWIKYSYKRENSVCLHPTIVVGKATQWARCPWFTLFWFHTVSWHAIWIR